MIVFSELDREERAPWYRWCSFPLNEKSKLTCRLLPLSCSLSQASPVPPSQAIATQDAMQSRPCMPMQMIALSCGERPIRLRSQLNCQVESATQWPCCPSGLSPERHAVSSEGQRNRDKILTFPLCYCFFLLFGAWTHCQESLHILGNSHTTLGHHTWGRISCSVESLLETECILLLSHSNAQRRWLGSMIQTSYV